MKKKLVFIILFLVLAVGSLWAYEQYILRQDHILSNVSINGVNVGGMTKEEARQALLPSGGDFEQASITIVWENGQKTVSAAELGLQSDWEKAVDEAMESGRSGNIFRRLQERARGRSIETQVAWDEEKAASVLWSVAEEAVTEPVSARIRFEDGKATVEAAKNGYAVDVEKNLETAKKDLTVFLEGVWRLEGEEISPEISTEEAESWHIEGIISTYTTKYNAGQANRCNNLELAAKTLDRTIVWPGEVFSFNESVGPRTTAAGYREAPIIRNNHLEPGVGGGVCQVATTVFNAVLEAGLPVVERFPHSLKVSYVPEGRDASVSFGMKDMKFRNDRETPVMIRTVCGGGSLTVSFYGKM